MDTHSQRRSIAVASNVWRVLTIAQRTWFGEVMPVDLQTVKPTPTEPIFLITHVLGGKCCEVTTRPLAITRRRSGGARGERQRAVAKIIGGVCIGGQMDPVSSVGSAVTVEIGRRQRVVQRPCNGIRNGNSGRVLHGDLEEGRRNAGVAIVLWDEGIESSHCHAPGKGVIQKGQISDGKSTPE